MIERLAKEALLRLCRQFPVVGVTGPRQSGKSTLVRNAFPQKEYVSFDNKSIRDLAASNPDDFLIAYPDGAIFDEAQKVPSLFDAVKLKVDSEGGIPGKYILTGSSQFSLKRNITESLAGRIGLINLLPLSLQEVKSAGLLEENAYKAFFKGFYPIFFDNAKEVDCEDWFQNYVDTYLDIDVKEQINPANLMQFKKVLQLCALYSGKLLNYESISKNVGVSSNTVKSWISILESSFIIHLLEPESNNMGRSLVKTPKLYFIDPGLLCYLLRIKNERELILSKHKGAVVETAAVSELLKTRYNKGRKSNLAFFRDKNGFEVDTIADWDKSFAIEIKSDSLSEQKLSSNVRKYAQERNDGTSPMIYYLGNLTCNINGTKYVSWQDWGKDPN